MRFPKRLVERSAANPIWISLLSILMLNKSIYTWYNVSRRPTSALNSYCFSDNGEREKTHSFDIVTCQPIVGLRNKALLGSRPLNASRPNSRCAAVGEAVFAPCRAEQNRTKRCYTAGRDDVTRQHARFQGNAGKHSDLTQYSSHLARKIEGL
jgi:hypothetical protein